MQQVVLNDTVLFLIHCVQIFVVRHALLYHRSDHINVAVVVVFIL